MSRFNVVIRVLVLLLCFNGVLEADTLDRLMPDERNTVEIFQKASPKVVYVHRLAKVMNRSFEKMNVPAGSGSGIIWDKRGYIVTNYHVIRKADDLAVTIGKQTFQVKVVGAEPRKDIAVLQIKSNQISELLMNFQPFEIVKSGELLVGQKTIAIGNPFGLDHSLTVGVVSALGRQVPGIGGVTIREMIQTDAPVNPGNSGGPLLDSQGRLIGMNTMIYSNSGSSAGVGFAVPAYEMERIVNQIIKNGRVVLAGIGILQVAPGIAQRLGITKGILIADVIPNTPAAKVGLRPTHRNHWGEISLGDVIIALNGHPVPDYDTLYSLLSNVNPGDMVTVTVVRNGKEMNFKLKTIDIAGVE